MTVAVSKTAIEGSTPSSGATRGWTNPAKSPRSDRGVSGFESLAAHQVCVACRIGRGVWLQSRSYAVRVRGGAPRRARATGSPPRPKRDVAQALQGSSPWLSAKFFRGRRRWPATGVESQGCPKACGSIPPPSARFGDVGQMAAQPVGSRPYRKDMRVRIPSSPPVIKSAHFFS